MAKHALARVRRLIVLQVHKTSFVDEKHMEKQSKCY